MSTQNLLVELFVEELPPKALKKLGESFANGIHKSLEINDFLESGAEVTSFASPRRLAVHITQVRAVSQPRPRSPETLMPIAVGLKDGAPTPALMKRLTTKLGYHDSVDIQWLLRERLFVEMEGGKEVLKHRFDLASGSQLAIGLEGAVLSSLAALPIPKVMTYQLADGWADVKFVRPAHGLLALHGTEVVAIEAMGLTSGRATSGHRFEATKPVVEIAHADSYAQQLREEGAVIASFA
ncbi:MAG: glycine--tRNA ligase subunit beta, partial [Vitreoscilla sp.]|nr:glycine--tRNA ligase subunit beta [Vitreoscilla sp.]